MEVNHVRHSGIYTVDGQGVTVVGAGGIGAITTLTLVKMGFKDIVVFDAESVEEENVATQFHPIVALNLPKVHSVRQQATDHDWNVNLEAYQEDVEITTDVTNFFIVSTVDSISSRQVVWEAVKGSRWQYFIDAGMGAQQLNLYTVSHKDIGWYEARLSALSDDDIEELPCTEKATFFTGMGAASFIGNTLKKLLVDEPVARLQVMNYVANTFWNSGDDTAVNIPALPE
jgi:hypothetical protein